MKLSRPFKNIKTRAQAMMEFALVIPILLLLVYGLLETGRYLFIYASTITAARQGVRYGSTTGTLPDGTTPYYKDCAGIEAAVRRTGFINTFDTIEISYDNGLDSSGIAIPNNLTCVLPASSNTFTPTNGSRVVVTVRTSWSPIVSIVPLTASQIVSTSERTILVPVPIAVTSVSQAANGTLTFDLAASPTTYSSLNQTITYTYTLSNTGAVGSGDIIGPFTISGVNCSGAAASLAPGASTTCAATVYSISQDDLDAGFVTKSATVTASNAGPITDSVTITAITAPALSLSISPSPSAAQTAGTNITYTYTLTNTGNVSLTVPYTVTDDIASGIVCPATPSPWKPTDPAIVCTGSYSILPGDITNGSVVNTATAQAMFGVTPVDSAAASATVFTKPLILTVSPSTLNASTVNQIITYNYTIKNNSGADITLTGVTDNKATVSGTCSGVVLANGNSHFCTGTYTVTTADYNAGAAIVSNAFATASPGLTSNTFPTTVSLTQNKSLTLSLVSATPSQPAGSMIAGSTTVTYVYSLTNSGNVTLTSPFTVNNGVSTTCGSIASIAPLTSANCTVTYTVTQANIDAGSFTKTATATGMFGATTVTSASLDTTVITYSAARFTLAIAASPTNITVPGTQVVFTYTVVNTGGKALTAIAITSSLGNGSDCTVASLALGATATCTPVTAYTPTATVTNTISASALDGVTPVTSTPASVAVTVTYNVCTVGNLTLGPPSTSGTRTTWTITNSTGSPLHLTSITVDWNINTPANNYLEDVQVPTGTSIGASADKTGLVTFSTPTYGPWTINAGPTTITMVFAKNNVNISDMTLIFSEYGCGPLSNP